MKFDVIKKDVVTSTNTLLKEMAHSGAKSGTVIIANKQTAGKGRMGRCFYSPENTGIYLSVLLREPSLSEPTLLTTAAAVAVMKAISRTTKKEPQVKWVNDILLDNKKVCGILTEGEFCESRLMFAIVGIGINVSTQNFPDDIKSRAGSIAADTSLKDELTQNLLFYLSQEFENADNREFLDYYRKRCVTVGKSIKIISPGKEPKEAFAEGIDDCAALIVRYADGTTENISSGEASIR